MSAWTAWNALENCKKRDKFFGKYFDIIERKEINENCLACPRCNIYLNKRLCDDVEKDFLIFKRKKKLQKLLQ